jgi:uncharacterized protein (TIGR03118 family)
MMTKKSKLVLLLAGTALVLSAWGAANAQAMGRSKYTQHNLVSDITVVPPATTPDPNLKNSWGIAFIPGGPIWINDNATGVATLYDGAGAITPLVVTIPQPAVPTGPNSSPTGMVWNGNPFAFVVPTTTTGALFIFSSEDGTISAWNLGLSDVTKAQLLVDNSQVPTAGNGAVYKGLALGANASGEFLYATNFRSGQIDVFDSTFKQVTLGASPIPGTFSDPKLPAGFAPFGIANIRGNLFVSYAMQNAQKHDDVAGKHSGYVDIFDTSGNLIQRFASKGALNSPWGIAEAPFNFGSASGTILIGNFGDGTINSFSTANGNPKGTLMDSTGKKPVVIDGLWALTFGGFLGADPGTLYFTAGINGEADGLFGSLTPQ